MSQLHYQELQDSRQVIELLAVRICFVHCKIKIFEWYLHQLNSDAKQIFEKRPNGINRSIRSFYTLKKSCASIHIYGANPHIVYLKIFLVISENIVVSESLEVLKEINQSRYRRGQYAQDHHMLLKTLLVTFNWFMFTLLPFPGVSQCFLIFFNTQIPYCSAAL